MPWTRHSSAIWIVVADMDVITFPHIEKALIGFLNAELTARGKTAWVSSQIPANRPTRLVRVTRAGGPRRDIINDQPTVIVECWDATETAAYDLANLCRGLIHAASLSDDPMGGVYLNHYEEFSGPARNPDPLTAYSRYQFTVSLMVTGSTL